MSFEIKLAWKYFRSRRKSLVRFTSIIAVVGIAAGVASLIIAQAISKGFSDEVRDKVLSNTSHISIYNEGETVIADWRIIKEKAEKIENVTGFEATTYESAAVRSEFDSSYAVIRVQSPKSKVQSPNDKSVPSALADASNSKLPKVSIGKELAEKLEVKIGDEVDVITLREGSLPKRNAVLVKDIFETGLFEYDSTWISVDEANYLKLKKTDKFKPKVFSVTVKDIYRADETADLIKKELGNGFKVLDWQEANKPLFAALSLERKVAVAVILLIILLAALNITTTLSLLINERKLDIAVLRTCGAKTKSIVSVFLFEGIILSLAGIVFGVISGLAVCVAGNYFKVISLAKEVYSLNYIPFNIDFWSILIIISLTFLLSLAAIFYPALKASRIKPLENLRRY